MSTSAPDRRAPRPPRPETPGHRFKIGQKVRLKGGFGRSTLPVDIYQVTGQLPPSGGVPQYRIRNDSERHERMTTEDSLELAGPPPRSGNRPDSK